MEKMSKNKNGNSKANTGGNNICQELKTKKLIANRNRHRLSPLICQGPWWGLYPLECTLAVLFF